MRLLVLSRFELAPQALFQFFHFREPVGQGLGRQPQAFKAIFTPARFGAGDFSQPLDPGAVRRRDELGEVAQAVDTMGRDIDRMLQAQRSLLLAISSAWGYLKRR